MDLAGKVAIVTGASRGVGAATAVALAAQGVTVACAARSTAAAPKRIPGTLDDTVEQARRAGEATGGDAFAVPTDLAQHDDVVAMIATTVQRCGGLDILINNAAITFPGDLEQPLKRHDLVMDVNYRAPYIAIREAVPHMRARGGGSIINLSSFAAMAPLPDMLAYGTSKIALEHLTVDAARILFDDNIAVNCFRIDVPVASEGNVASMPGADLTNWEPTAVPAEGILWMLNQPVTYTGHRESMYHLREREHIMASRSERPYLRPTPPPTELFSGHWILEEQMPGSINPT